MESDNEPLGIARAPAKIEIEQIRERKRERKREGKRERKRKKMKNSPGSAA